MDRPLKRAPCPCVRDGDVDMEQMLQPIISFVEMGEIANKLCPQVVLELLAAALSYKIVELFSVKEALFKKYGGGDIPIEFLGDVYSDAVNNIADWLNLFSKRMSDDKESEMFAKCPQIKIRKLDMSIVYEKDTDRPGAGPDDGKKGKGDRVRRRDDRAN